jgi:hypothetical protein
VHQHCGLAHLWRVCSGLFPERRDRLRGRQRVRDQQRWLWGEPGVYQHGR